MQMTKEITTQILNNEKIGKKLLSKGQLQIVTFFVEVLKPRDLVRPSSSIGGSIWHHVSWKQWPYQCQVMPLYDDEMKYIPIHVQCRMHKIKTLMDDLLTIVQTKHFSLILLLVLLAFHPSRLVTYQL